MDVFNQLMFKNGQNEVIGFMQIPIKIFSDFDTSARQFLSWGVTVIRRRFMSRFILLQTILMTVM